MLPLQTSAHCVGASTFQLPDPLIKMQGRFDRSGNMNVRFSSTDSMKISSLSLNDLIFKKRVKVRLHRTGDQLQIILCVPRYVQIYF